MPDILGVLSCLLSLEVQYHIIVCIKGRILVLISNSNWLCGLRQITSLFWTLYSRSLIGYNNIT